MVQLTPQQRDRALEVMREYLSAPANPDGRAPREVQTDRDRSRVKLIEGELGSLVRGYLDGSVVLGAFKSQIDGVNKRNAYWGFRGVKGQMFFNMIVNVSDDEKECDHQLKSAIAVPATEEGAGSRIARFSDYVNQLGERFLKGGGSKVGRPKPRSIPFFLSYFWQIQDRLEWPVYYTNTVNTLSDLNLWQPKGDLSDDYLEYKRLHEELSRVFSAASGEPFGFYEVEHVFWLKGGNPTGGNRPMNKESPHPAPTHLSAVLLSESITRLPESYVPPIIAALPLMSRNDPQLQDAAKNSGTSLERAFEKGVDAAFRILGYETELMGQGQGRVPDGIAASPDDSYAIIWDAKVREKHYTMGTDDRAIREYVTTQNRELKRKGTLRNMYYAIVSSRFAGDFEGTVKSLKMETHIKEVVLIEADALVAMVDAKLREPRALNLGPDGLQQLLSEGGVLHAEDVKELLG